MLLGLRERPAGTMSGWVWGAVSHSYTSFFTLVLLFSVSPVILAWLAPFPHREQVDAAATARHL